MSDQSFALLALIFCSFLFSALPLLERDRQSCCPPTRNYRPQKLEVGGKQMLVGFDGMRRIDNRCEVG